MNVCSFCVKQSETRCCFSKPEKSRECYLIICILILLTLIILLSTGLVINYNRTKETKAVLKGNFSGKPIFCKPRSKREVCLTEGCVNAAYHILERANLSVDPCEDFYEFACGTFVHNTKIPDSKSGVTMFSQAMDSLKQKLRILIEDENTHHDSEATTKTKELYASCMDIDRIEEKGLHPLYDILDFLGGWPVLEGDDWDSKNFSWIGTLLKKRKIGFSINSIFIFDVDINVKNSSQWMIWFDQPILTLPREYFISGLNESDVQKFFQYAVDLAVLLGANKTTAEEEMTEVLEFMIDMSKNSMPREYRRNIQHIHNVMNLTQLYELAPLLNWTETINKILPDNIKVDDSELVNVGDVQYFGNLTDLLNKTPDSMSYAVSNLYVKHYFQKRSKEQVEHLVTYLRNNFDDMLKGLEWMDDETKKQALKKERAINSYIGYPEELLHDENIAEHYSNGRQYDMDGNLGDWWQNDTEKRFLEKTNCIIEQYGNYTSETHKIKINGIYTQGENIADNGGIRVAYKAYMKWVEENGEEEMLPGLGYTPNQLFWVASAQIWCSVFRPELLRNKIISDNHSPENFRVNGPLSNFDKFSNDWKCGANSKMNPKHKCIVW
ncbi:Endothelin-converting enzyme 2 [Armadillidium nasatum]|uniref:Endothelin-converting enzyme 2 n=1 Tax=Armadillidium nasatum TaxID=96803 RepID=A0A5N5SKE9_9CRUS|nr:Endothelin-converting enzyme 2 [Armadillidium nasatum]